MRLLLASVLLVSSAAFGQTLTLQFQNEPDGELTVSRNRCGGPNVPVLWGYTGTQAPCEQLRLWVTTDASCGKEAKATDYPLEAVPRENIITAGSVTRTLEIARLPIFTATDGGTATACGDYTNQTEMRLCGFTKAYDLTGFSCNVEVQVSGTVPTLTFDAKAPNPPSITNVISRDSELAVSVSAEEDSNVYVTAVALTDAGTPEGPEITSDEKVAGQGVLVVENLQNGVTYSLVARARDEADNTSDPSAEARGTPLKSSGIYEAYVNAKGEETGGCAATGGSIAGGALLAALGFWLSSRRKVS